MNDRDINLDGGIQGGRRQRKSDEYQHTTHTYKMIKISCFDYTHVIDFPIILNSSYIHPHLLN